MHGLAAAQCRWLLPQPCSNTGLGDTLPVRWCRPEVTLLCCTPQVHCHHLPDCLHELTWLEGLHWHGDFDCDRPRDGPRELEFKLSPLRHLTYLFFNITGCEYW